MGQFKIEITAVGGHGCIREAKEGERVYGCRRMDCPDCAAADFVERLARTNAMNIKATFTHWPGEPTEVVDRIEPTGHRAKVTRESGYFGMPPRPTTIIVNGRSRVVTGESLSHDEIAALAGCSPDAAPTIIWHTKQGRGVIARGQYVPVRSGLTIDCDITSAA